MLESCIEIVAFRELSLCLVFVGEFGYPPPSQAHVRMRSGLRRATTQKTQYFAGKLFDFFLSKKRRMIPKRPTISPLLPQCRSTWTTVANRTHPTQLSGHLQVFIIQEYSAKTNTLPDLTSGFVLFDLQYGMTGLHSDC